MTGSKDAGDGDSGPMPLDRTSSVTATCQQFAEQLEKDSEIRESIKAGSRNLEQTTRKLLSVIQMIHIPGSLSKMDLIVAELERIFNDDVRPQMAVFSGCISVTEYFRFQGMFWGTMQKLVYAAAMKKYLDSEELLERDEACDVLGVKNDPNDGFHLELEDYLAGLIQLGNELSRFTLNCVTQCDFNRPIRISTFLGDLFTGFRMLNLKNDTLRRRYDSLKYDVKRVEEVVYDISLRGLAKPIKPKASAGPGKCDAEKNTAIAEVADDEKGPANSDNSDEKSTANANPATENAEADADEKSTANTENSEDKD